MAVKARTRHHLVTSGHLVVRTDESKENRGRGLVAGVTIAIVTNQLSPQPWPTYGAAEAKRPDRAMIWPIAWLSGICAFGVLVAVHLTIETTGSTAHRVEEMIIPAVVSTVVVAGVAFVTSTTRRWPWPLITLGVFTVAALWYGVIAVLPQVFTDARADANGQADYSLTTPLRAGDWHRMDGPLALHRREQALSRIAAASPDLEQGVEDYAYAEYRHPSGAVLAYFGVEATGDLEDELRTSTENSVEVWMTTLGAQHLQSVDAGDLGGSMDCTGTGPGLTAGMVYCAWADASTLGQVTIAQPGLDVDTAAAVARNFRAHATKR